MYDDHFGLNGRPFQLTPDPRFWFETATHKKAMAYLGYGLAQGEGFIVITGDIGAGKTTLVGHLMDTVDHQRLNPIRIVSTAIEASDLLRIVATALGVPTQGLEKADLLLAIERGLHAVARMGKRTLLIVDEAQALPVASLEELRMLSNFQAGGHAMLQIVLLGQPEFRDRLHGEDRLEQLRQRVIAIHHLDPMEPEEVADYIAHRLAVVGWQGRPDFTEDAFDAFYRGSDGVPRRLNLLAGRVMLHAAVEGVELIDGRIVDAVVRDLQADLPMHGHPGPRDAAPAAIASREPLAGAPMPIAAPAPAAATVDATEPPSRPIVTQAAVPAMQQAAAMSEPLSPPVSPDRGEAAPVADGAPAAPAPSRPLSVAPASEPAARPAASRAKPSWLEPDTDAPPAPTPIRAVATPQPAPQPVAASPAPAPQPSAVRPPAPKPPVAEPPSPTEAPAAKQEPATPPHPADPDVALVARVAALEAQVEQQEAALRRVLTLLVDWVEADGERPPYAPMRNFAA